MEFMMLYDAPWDDNYHHSSLPENFENNIRDIYTPNIVETFSGSPYIHNINSEKILVNIEEVFPLEILIKPKIVVNVHIVAYYSTNQIMIYKAPFQEF